MKAEVKMSCHLIDALKSRHSDLGWRERYWSLPQHLQMEVLFWARESGVPCKELIISAWQSELLKQIPDSAKTQ
jgi:hypothetical protein